ncbi:MAG: extracellular solute-binding protein, partial [bacterium]|nr:extracellular solute-binding protein [bacterium]
EYWVSQAYGENIFLELDEKDKPNVDFFIPKKGGTMYIDNMVILKEARHKDWAYAFINYIHEPEVYAKIADFLSLPSINVEARKHVKNPTLYSVEDLESCEVKDDLGAALELYNKIWQEIRIEN